MPKRTITVGDRIRLIRMNDPDPIEPGATGTIIAANERQVMVEWDNGRSLMLAIPEDAFTTIREVES